MTDSDRLRFTARRTLLGAGTGAALLVIARPGRAQGLAALTQRDASAGVRAALERGANVAVDLLGRTDGFWGNDLVRIPLPDWLARAESTLKLLGRGRDVEELRVGVNRAAGLDNIAGLHQLAQLADGQPQLRPGAHVRFQIDRFIGHAILVGLGDPGHES